MENSFADKRNKIINLEKGRGIKYLLDKAFEIIGHPMLMFDTSYTLLTTNDVVTDDWVWNEIKEFGTFRQETVDFFNREHFIEAFAVSETVAFMKSKHLRYERANGKLFDKDNVQLGNISVVACFKPFEEGDMQLIELLCEILSVELQNSDTYQQINRVYQQDSLINKIISGDVVESENMLAELYDGLKTNLYLAVVDIIQYDETNTHMAYFRDLFKRIQDKYKYYVHLNNIVIILSTDNEIISVETDLKELNVFFEKYKIYAGISSKFQDIAELKKRFGEALTALNYGLDSGRTQNIFNYDDFRIEHFLYSSEDATNELLSPIISEIQKYDNKNNTDFLNIIYVYLLHGMNSLLVTGKLGITNEELLAKLKKSEEIFKIDWTNGNMLYNLFLSIKLINR